MAIQLRTIGSFTEAYIEGGGNTWITESFPTNFHTFVKRRVAKSESEVTNYMEVNDSQKAALEKSDAVWVEPSAELIARWNDRCNVVFGGGQSQKLGQYNSNTGFFEYGSLKDISADSALLALEIPEFYHPATSLAGYNGVKFILPIKNSDNNGVDGLNIKMESARYVRTVAFYTYYSNYTQTNWGGIFENCWNLREILIPLSVNKADASMFGACRSLKDVKIADLKSDLAIKDTPVLSLESMAYMVAEAKNTDSITITVHPDVYAKLTDESNSEWHAVALGAAERNIAFATTS